jgi:hypothetical protein
MFGQLRIDSPYSRFGLGDVNPGYNASQSSMGGVAFAIRDPLRINILNPASYINIDSSSFVFNAGFSGFLIQTKSSSQSGNSNYFNIGNLNFAMPFTKWWKTSAGLVPYSTIGYDVNVYEEIDSIGTVRYGYLGDGGASRIYWGNAFRISKNFAAGVNMSYIFGNLNLRRESEMLDLAKSFNYRYTNTVNIKSLYFEYGIQYHTSLGNKKDYFLDLGLVYANQQNFKAVKSALAYTYSEGTEGYEYHKDTVLNTENGVGNIIIPQKIGAGFSFGKEKSWMMAADVSFEEWSKYSAFGVMGILNNSIKINFGGRYFIGKYALNMGFMYNESYLTLHEKNINDYGISFGVGIPLMSQNNPPSTSYMDLGFEFGRRGTLANSLIQQDYIKIKLGLNIRNTWFQRPKYL